MRYMHACELFWLSSMLLSNMNKASTGTLCGIKLPIRVDSEIELCWLEEGVWADGRAPECDACTLLVLSKLKELEESD